MLKASLKTAFISTLCLGLITACSDPGRKKARINPSNRAGKLSSGETADNITKLINDLSKNSCSDFAEVAPAESVNKIDFVNEKIFAVEQVLQSKNRLKKAIHLDELQRVKKEQAFAKDTYYRLSSIIGIIDIQDEYSGQSTEKYIQFNNLNKLGEISACASYGSHSDKAFNPNTEDQQESVNFFKYNTGELDLARTIMFNKEGSFTIDDNEKFVIEVSRDDSLNNQESKTQLQIQSTNVAKDLLERLKLGAFSALKASNEQNGVYLHQGNVPNFSDTQDDILTQVTLHRIANSGDVLMHIKSRTILDKDNKRVINEFVLIYKQSEKKKAEKKEDKKKES